MTSEKLIRVFMFYKTELEGRDVVPSRSVDYALTGSEQGSEMALAHLVWMCDEANTMVTAGRKEKAFRWLGFIQGVLWTQGIFTLDDLKEHSRPDTN